MHMCVNINTTQLKQKERKANQYLKVMKHPIFTDNINHYRAAFYWQIGFL